MKRNKRNLNFQPKQTVYPLMPARLSSHPDVVDWVIYHDSPIKVLNKGLDIAKIEAWSAPYWAEVDMS